MLRIFVSDSHRDEAWKERVVKQLGLFAEEGVSARKDRQIAASQELLSEHPQR